MTDNEAPWGYWHPNKDVPYLDIMKTNERAQALEKRGLGDDLGYPWSWAVGCEHNNPIRVLGSTLRRPGCLPAFITIAFQAVNTSIKQPVPFLGCAGPKDMTLTLSSYPGQSTAA